MDEKSKSMLNKGTDLLKDEDLQQVVGGVGSVPRLYRTYCMRCSYQTDLFADIHESVRSFQAQHPEHKYDFTSAPPR